MKKNRRIPQTYSLTPVKISIDSLSHDGRGIARVDGKTTFVTGALPGETIEMVYYQNHPHFDEAIAETVLEASHERTTPLCPHFLRCGGCNLQHLNSMAQRQHKQNVLLEQLQHFGQMTSVPSEAIFSPLYDTSSQGPWEYRYRARLSVQYSNKKDKVFVGFRERIHSRFVTDMQTCDILLPMIGKNIAALREFMNSLDGKAQIPQIEIVADDTVCALIVRHLAPLSENDQKKWIAFGELYHYWIISQPGSINKLVWLLPNTPQDFSYRYIEADIQYYFNPAHFTQVNPRMNQRLIHKALELLDPQSTDTVLDLFCGLGNFSLPIAKKVKAVVGVEGSQMMVDQAAYNAKANDIHNAFFYMSDLSIVLGAKDFRKASWVRPVDKILLDPSRAGALEIVNSIELWNPACIVYVSCNPATLARDAGILVNEKGYRLVQAGIADMFPHTSHVESLALFVTIATLSS